MFTSDQSPRCVLSLDYFWAIIIIFVVHSIFHDNQFKIRTNTAFTLMFCAQCLDIFILMTWYFSSIEWKWYQPRNTKSGFHITPQVVSVDLYLYIASAFATYQIEQTILILLCINMTNQNTRVKLLIFHNCYSRFPKFFKVVSCSSESWHDCWLFMW